MRAAGLHVAQTIVTTTLPRRSRALTSLPLISRISSTGAGESTETGSAAATPNAKPKYAAANMTARRNP
jgi:hypothetical protein